MKWIEFFKTFAWAFPLTVLIWIYAEREQAITVRGPFPIEVRITSGNKIVTLKTPSDPNVVITLSGPNNILKQITNNHEPIQINLPANTPIGETTFNFSQFMSDYPAFVSQGVTVQDPSPPQLKVEIDKIESQMLDVHASARVSPNDPNPTDFAFFPPQVKVTAPHNTFERAIKDKKYYVVADTSKARASIHAGKNELDGLPISCPFEGEHVTIETPVVKGLINIETVETLKLSSVPVWLEIAPTVADKWIVTRLSQNTIANVELSGPKELLSKVSLPDNIPHFSLEILDADTKDPPPKIQRTLRFANLPEGVKITNNPEQYTVTFSLTERER